MPGAGQRPTSLPPSSKKRSSGSLRVQQAEQGRVGVDAQRRAHEAGAGPLGLDQGVGLAALGHAREELGGQVAEQGLSGGAEEQVVAPGGGGELHRPGQIGGREAGPDQGPLILQRAAAGVDQHHPAPLGDGQQPAPQHGQGRDGVVVGALTGDDARQAPADPIAILQGEAALGVGGSEGVAAGVVQAGAASGTAAGLGPVQGRTLHQRSAGEGAEGRVGAAGPLHGRAGVGGPQERGLVGALAVPAPAQHPLVVCGLHGLAAVRVGAGRAGDEASVVRIPLEHQRPTTTWALSRG